MRRLASIAGAVAALTCLSACGADSDDGARTTVPPAAGETWSPAAQEHGRNEGTAGIPSPSRSLDVNPCKLVTRAEAQTILGTRVSKPALGSQGPTCVYQAPRIRQAITVAVQHGAVPSVDRTGDDVIRTEVGGRKAVCVDDGGLKVLVPLSPSSVLAVGAPCPIATELAAAALRRLD